MKINDQSVKDNEDTLKRLNKNLEKRISRREADLENVDSEYDKKIEQAKTEGEESYFHLLEQNQKKAIDESIHTEEKIQNYQDQLKNVQSLIDKEEVSLKVGEKNKIDNLKNQFQASFQDQYLVNQERQREIQSESRNALSEITTKSKAEKMIMEHNAQAEMNALSADLNQKSLDNENNFRTQIDKNVRAHQAELKMQKDELKKMGVMDFEKNKRIEEEKKRVQNGQIEFLDKHQQGLLKQRQDDFKVRYEQIASQHNSILKDLSQKLEADVKKMVEETSSQKKTIENKINDQFYRVEKLNPKIVENENDIVISMPVAEYEKENVHLSTQGRNIKITLSRKYNDSVNSVDGSLNKSTRSELYSKELNVADIMNPEGITQNYQDGMLSFKIKKA